MNSGTLATGSAKGTSSRYGAYTASPMGAKSFCGSYGIFVPSTGASARPATMRRMRSMPPNGSTKEPIIRSLVTYGDWGLWPDTKDDTGGLDNAGVIYWDPTVTGPDETGTEGKGMYRALNNGLRYLAGQWPTEPLPLFQPEGTVTEYAPGAVPPELVPPTIPVPPDAPAAKK